MVPSASLEALLSSSVEAYAKLLKIRTRVVVTAEGWGG